MASRLLGNYGTNKEYPDTYTLSYTNNISVYINVNDPTNVFGVQDSNGKTGTIKTNLDGKTATIVPDERLYIEDPTIDADDTAASLVEYTQNFTMAVTPRSIQLSPVVAKYSNFFAKICYNFTRINRSNPIVIINEMISLSGTYKNMLMREDIYYRAVAETMYYYQNRNIADFTKNKEQYVETFMRALRDAHQPITTLDLINMWNNKLRTNFNNCFSLFQPRGGFGDKLAKGKKISASSSSLAGASLLSSSSLADNESITLLSKNEHYFNDQIKVIETAIDSETNEKQLKKLNSSLRHAISNHQAKPLVWNREHACTELSFGVTNTQCNNVLGTLVSNLDSGLKCAYCGFSITDKNVLDACKLTCEHLLEVGYLFLFNCVSPSKSCGLNKQQLDEINKLFQKMQNYHYACTYCNMIKATLQRTRGIFVEAFEETGNIKFRPNKDIIKMFANTVASGDVGGQSKKWVNNCVGKDMSKQYFSFYNYITLKKKKESAWIGEINGRILGLIGILCNELNIICDNYSGFRNIYLIGLNNFFILYLKDNHLYDDCNIKCDNLDHEDDEAVGMGMGMGAASLGGENHNHLNKQTKKILNNTSNYKMKGGMLNVDKLDRYNDILNTIDMKVDILNIESRDIVGLGLDKITNLLKNIKKDNPVFDHILKSLDNYEIIIVLKSIGDLHDNYTPILTRWKILHPPQKQQSTVFKLQDDPAVEYPNGRPKANLSRLKADAARLAAGHIEYVLLKNTDNFVIHDINTIKNNDTRSQYSIDDYVTIKYTNNLDSTMPEYTYTGYIRGIIENGIHIDGGGFILLNDIKDINVDTHNEGVVMKTELPKLTKRSKSKVDTTRPFTDGHRTLRSKRKGEGEGEGKGEGERGDLHLPNTKSLRKTGPGGGSRKTHKKTRNNKMRSRKR